MPHDRSHSTILSRSSCSSLQSSLEATTRYAIVSSAKSRTCDDSESGRSLIKTRNKIGPRTDPCGTPDVTGADAELSPSTTTLCDRPDRKSSIHGSTLPRIPYHLSFYSRRACDTLSKALEKSMTAVSVCWPMDSLEARSCM